MNVGKFLANLIRYKKGRHTELQFIISVASLFYILFKELFYSVKLFISLEEFFVALKIFYIVLRS